MKIDLEKKKTEAEWLNTQEKFILNATPIWFTWIGWVLILGALYLILDKSKNIYVGIVFTISFILFTLYFINYFYQFEFKNFTKIKNQKIARIISILLSAALGFSLFYLFNNLAVELFASGT